MIRLQILSGKKAGQTILVRHFPFSIGRSAKSQLLLEDPGVWDDHCSIEYRPLDGFHLRVSDGREVRLEGEAVNETGRLQNAAEISLGGARLRFSLADPEPRGLKLREGVAWLFLAAVVIGEIWLIRWLP